MTRINLGIDPRNLTDEHLLAEHREIKRIPSCYVKAKASGSINRIPEKFCLGRGHVLFFINKPYITLPRYQNLLSECKRRGFNVQDYSTNWDIYPNILPLELYQPTEEDKAIIIHRITEKIVSSNKSYFHYEGKNISKEYAINLLKNEP